MEHGLGKTLVSNLDCVKEDILKREYDAVFIVCGYEGTGKSTFSARCCFYLDDDFKQKQMVLERGDWEKIKTKLRRGNAACVDEGSEFAYSKEGMHAGVIDFEKELTQWRARGLFIFINISDVKNLTRYIRESRALGMFWIPKRGVVWAYSFVTRDAASARKVFELKKKLLNGIFPRPSFKDTFERFASNDPFWKEYMQRKNSFMRREKESKNVRRLREKMEMKMEGSATVRDVSNIYKCAKATAHKYVKRYVAKKHMFLDFSKKLRITKDGLAVLNRKLMKKMWRFT